MISPHNDERVMLTFERMFCSFGVLEEEVEDNVPKVAIYIVRCHGGAVPKNEETLSVLNCERRTFEVDCGEMDKFYYVRHKKVDFCKMDITK